MRGARFVFSNLFGQASISVGTDVRADKLTKGPLRVLNFRCKKGKDMPQLNVFS